MEFNKLIDGLTTQGGDFLRNMSDEDMEKHLPWVYNLKGRLQPPKWHPEGDAFVHTYLVVDRAVELGGDPQEVFGAMCHDLGKAVTPDDNLPHHYDHESLGVPLVHKLCDAFNAPDSFRETAWRASKYHLLVHKLNELKTITRVRLIRNLGQYQASVGLISQADAQGRGPEFINKPYPQRNLLAQIHHAMNELGGEGEKIDQIIVRYIDDAGMGKKKSNERRSRR
jgi:tRNA nucleotidyltransferase (CCA-adding enzyme)